jgi:hypothetical protein
MAVLAAPAEKAEKAASADVLKPRHGVRAPVAPAAAAVMAAPVAAAAADVAASQSVSQASGCPATPLKIKIPSNIPTEMPPMLPDNPAKAEIHPPVKMPSEWMVNPVILVSFTLSNVPAMTALRPHTPALRLRYLPLRCKYAEPCLLYLQLTISSYLIEKQNRNTLHSERIQINKPLMKC